MALLILSYVLGYSFALFVGHFSIRLMLDKLWLSLKQDYKTNESVISTVQGLIERLLFVTAFQMNKPSFIGIWLALKVASQWKKWSEKPGYNIFLIGSGLSILYSKTGSLIITAVKECAWIELTIPLGLILATLLLFLWINHNIKKKNK